MKKEIIIPKTVNYCWFGGNKIPEKLVKCMDTWKEFLYDYEFVEWNESNFNVEINTYVKQAYEEKKYAFVSDYARFFILYNYGGIYLDTDVNVVKSFDSLLCDKAFIGFESLRNVGPDTMGAVAGNEIIKRALDGYTNREFICRDGSYDYTPISTYMNPIFVKEGMVNDNSLQNINGFKVYPVEYFHPLDFWTKKLNLTENTYSIHMWSESWKSFPERMKTQFHRIVGNKVMKRLSIIKKSIKTSNNL